LNGEQAVGHGLIGLGYLANLRTAVESVVQPEPQVASAVDRIAVLIGDLTLVIEARPKDGVSEAWFCDDIRIVIRIILGCQTSREHNSGHGQQERENGRRPEDPQTINWEHHFLLLSAI
jgi:hypothetical protein